MSSLDHERCVRTVPPKGAVAVKPARALMQEAPPGPRHVEQIRRDEARRRGRPAERPGEIAERQRLRRERIRQRCGGDEGDEEGAAWQRIPQGLRNHTDNSRTLVLESTRSVRARPRCERPARARNDASCITRRSAPPKHAPRRRPLLARHPPRPQSTRPTRSTARADRDRAGWQSADVAHSGRDRRELRRHQPQSDADRDQRDDQRRDHPAPTRIPPRRPAGTARTVISSSSRKVAAVVQAAAIQP